MGISGIFFRTNPLEIIEKPIEKMAIDSESSWLVLVDIQSDQIFGPALLLPIS